MRELVLVCNKYNYIMTQENKELLLADLCGRLQYGVKISVNDNIESLQGINVLDGVAEYGSFLSCDIDEVKPYLFPMSSMTEWQERELEILMKNSIESCGMLSPYDCLEMERFFNENHLDWRDLVPKGLAIDATGKNIY